MTGDPDGRPYYGTVRRAGGIFLLGLAAVLMVLDALSPDYDVDSIQLGLIFGTALVLLGVEAGRKLLGGG